MHQLNVACVVVLLTICVAARAELDATSSGGAPLELTESTFDATVYPADVPFEEQQPFFIFFYAPWCGHCKKMKPIFSNASEYLMSKYSKEHARFALVDATSQKALAKRFNVKAFPTFYYTTNGRAYAYEGGRGLSEFVSISVYVFHGTHLRSFADDVSSPGRFESVDKEAPGRAAFVTFFPRGVSGLGTRRNILPVDRTLYAGKSAEELLELETKEREEAAPHLWHIMVESSISLGKSRFAVIYEDHIPNTVSGNHAQFSRVMEVAHRCQKHSKGPNGASLILYSDAHRKPLCYQGPWLTSRKDPLGSVSPYMPLAVAKMTVHKELHDWIDRNSFLAVEEISSETYAAMSRRPGLLMVLATNGPLDKDDTSMLPVLRDIVQTRNAIVLASDESLKSNVELVDESGASARPKIEYVFAHLDGNLFNEWCVQHGLHVPDDFPALLAVSPMKEIAYHAKAVDGFVAVKNDLPWKVGGPQQEQIRQFMAMVDRGEIPAFRASTIGKVAEYLLNTVPYAEVLYEALGEDDTSFLTVLFVVVFTIFVLILACRPDHSEKPLTDLGGERRGRPRHRAVKEE